MVRAVSAHALEKPDEAEAAIKEVLAQRPKDFHARRLMADVHRFRGQYEKAEEALTALWTEKGFDDEDAQLTPEDRAIRDRLEDQFNELYSAWSSKVDATAEADKFEKVVRSGLKWNKKSPTLNRILVDHLSAKAAKLEEEGKKPEAITAYESVLELRAMPAQRKEIGAKVGALKKAVFIEKATTHFEGQKAAIQGEGALSEDGKTVTFRVEVDVDKRWKSKNEADLEKARKAAAGATRTAVAQWVARLSGVDEAVAAATAPKIGSGDEKLSRGKYSVAVSLGIDDVMNAAFATQEKANARAAAAQKKAAADPKGAENAPQKPDGEKPADAPTEGSEAAAPKAADDAK